MRVRKIGIYDVEDPACANNDRVCSTLNIEVVERHNANTRFKTKWNRSGSVERARNPDVPRASAIRFTTD